MAKKVMIVAGEVSGDQHAARLVRDLRAARNDVEFFGIGGDVDVNGANAQMAAASANPMNAVSSNAISNTANNNKETNVQVGQVTVQTQATDSQGISQAIGGDLSAQLKNLEAETATGVDR